MTFPLEMELWIKYLHSHVLGAVINRPALKGYRGITPRMFFHLILISYFLLIGSSSA